MKINKQLLLLREGECHAIWKLLFFLRKEKRGKLRYVKDVFISIISIITIRGKR